MKSIRYTLITALLASSAAFAQDPSTGWIDRGTDNGVALSERAESVRGFKGFKGILRVNAPMKTVLALVLVRETFPKCCQHAGGFNTRRWQPRWLPVLHVD
jgi:hypothetical protein